MRGSNVAQRRTAKRAAQRWFRMHVRQARPLSWAVTSRGLLLLCLGIVVGVLMRRLDSYIWQTIVTGIQEEDSGLLLTAAAQIALTNTVRVFPLYWGAFTLMEAWVPAQGAWPVRLGGYFIPAALVPIAYVIIRFLFGIPYDFGTPALAGVLLVMVLHWLSRGRQGPFNKGLIFGLVIFGLQWLGMAPMLGGLGFGRGDLTAELKLAAGFLNRLPLLDVWSMMAGLLFIGLAFIMAKYMVDYHDHMMLLRRHQAQEREMQKGALLSLQARNLQEMQRLVHDLKTPLMTIQGLVGLLALGAANQDKGRAHAHRIDGAIDSMSHMISEILYRDAKRRMSGQAFIRYLQAHISGGGLSAVRFDVANDLPEIEVNAVRLTRAMVNLVQNAVEATPKSGIPPIVYARNARGHLRIVVRDFGKGLWGEQASKVWTPGYSTKVSSGLGMSFAREVIVDDLGGRIRLYSRRGRGTIVDVELPEVRE